MLKRAFLLALVAPGGMRESVSPRPKPLPAPVREFVVANTTLDPNLDPLHTYTTFESQFYTAIYEGLSSPIRSRSRPSPAVAASWETADNGKTWTFHSGPTRSTPTATRCARRISSPAWLRMLDPANNAENSYLFDVIKGARALQDGRAEGPVPGRDQGGL